MARITAIVERLDAVATKVEETRAALATVEVDAVATVDRVASTVARVSTSVASARSQVVELEGAAEGAVKSIEQTLTGASGGISTAAGKVTALMDGAVDSVSKASKRVQEEGLRMADGARSSAGSAMTALENVTSRGIEMSQDFRATIAEFLETTTEETAEAVTRQLDSLSVGATTIQEFREFFKETEVEIGGRVKTIDQLIIGLDLESYGKTVQNLSTDLVRGAADLDDVISLLNERSGKLGNNIKGWLEAYRSGNETLDELSVKISSIQSVFSGSDLDNLLGSLVDQLRSGNAQGTI